MKRWIGAFCAVLIFFSTLSPAASALTVEQALELLEENYIEELPPGAYEAEDLAELFQMVGDPYTYYMTEEQYDAFLSSVESSVELVGIGVSIRYTSEGILVVSVLEGSSALEVGIRSGDRIIAVDGVSCVPADESHRALILGTEGTLVQITVRRGDEILDFTLERRRVVIPNTVFDLVNGHIGLVDCDSFGSTTGTLFSQGVEAHNEAVDCWLVDLRGNPGGVTSSAVAAVGLFAGAGNPLYLQTRSGMLFYYQYPMAPATSHPVVVMTDSQTASAAEAFAADIRDLGLGITVGRRTYGKGVAQVVCDKNNLPAYFDGDALKLTAYRFYSTGGITNDRIGVIPTLLVDEAHTEAVAKALCGDPTAEEQDLLRIRFPKAELSVNLRATAADTLSALLSALPPQAELTLRGEPTTVVEAADAMGIIYEPRWFNDLHDSPFANEVNTLGTYGIVEGDELGRFHPSANLTRGELCAMLSKALHLPLSAQDRFLDVPADSPYAPYINAVAQIGLVKGDGRGTFSPDAPVTQEQYCIILSRLAQYLSLVASGTAQNLTQSWLDMAERLGFAPWACADVGLVSHLGLTCFASDELEPQALISRDEAAASLYAVLAYTGILPVYFGY